MCLPIIEIFNFSWYVSQNIVIAFVTDCYTFLSHEGKGSIKRLVLGGWVLGVCRFFSLVKKRNFPVYTGVPNWFVSLLFIEPFREHIKG